MRQAESEFTAFRRKFFISFSLFTITLFFGTYGYWLIGERRYSLLDCFYMTVITVATVGYREVIDVAESPVGKLFTVFLIFAGMSVILYFFSNVTAFLIEADIKEIFWRRRMQKLIDQMSGHYIVCGGGRMGRHVAAELHQTRRHGVIVDSDPQVTRTLMQEFPGMGFITGDATENDTLVDAGLERAKGLIAATGLDKDNLVIILTARQVAPNIRIVARCNDIKNAEKLRRAGADSVVSPNYIGGLRMVSEMLRPTVVTFLDRMLRDTEKNYRIEEVKIAPNSALSGKSASELRARVLLLAVMHEDGSYEYNPDGSLILKPGMTVIFMGSPSDRIALEKMAV